MRVNSRKLKALRLARDWSLDDVAERSGVNRQTVHRIEAGTHGSTRLTTAKKLAELFGVPVAHLETRGRTKEGGSHAESFNDRGVAGVEDSLGELLRYIKSLQGLQRTKFIRATVALLTALESSTANVAQRDQRTSTTEG